MIAHRRGILWTVVAYMALIEPSDTKRRCNVIHSLLRLRYFQYSH